MDPYLNVHFYNFQTTDLLETMENGNNQNIKKSNRADLNSLPTRQYLDQTINPILLPALKALAKQRPADPVDFMIEWLKSAKTTEHQ
jgi:protein dpy-30